MRVVRIYQHVYKSTLKRRFMFIWHIRRITSKSRKHLINYTIIRTYVDTPAKQCCARGKLMSTLKKVRKLVFAYETQQ